MRPATAIELGPNGGAVGQIPADAKNWLQYFPTVATGIFRTDKIMATITAYGAIGTYPRESMARGDQPPVGRTKGQVTGFRGRSGRSFRAKLKLEQNEEGKWRVDFDEDWAQGPRGTPPSEDET